MVFNSVRPRSRGSLQAPSCSTPSASVNSPGSTSSGMAHVGAADWQRQPARQRTAVRANSTGALQRSGTQGGQGALQRSNSSSALRRSGNRLFQTSPVRSSVVDLVTAGHRSPAVSKDIPMKSSQVHRRSLPKMVNRDKQALQFEDIFKLSYKRAAKRTACERRQSGAACGQLISACNNLLFQELGQTLGKGSMANVLAAQLKSQEESRWAAAALQNPRDGHDLTEGNSQSLNDTAQQRKSNLLVALHISGSGLANATQKSNTAQKISTEPWREKRASLFFQPERKNSFNAGYGFGISTVETAPKRKDRTSSHSTDSDEEDILACIPDEVEVKEILEPPDQQAMFDRFNADFHTGFPEREKERMALAFKRFKGQGSADCEVADLEQILTQLGYLKISLDVIQGIVQGITKFSTIDFDEFMQFMTAYAEYERKAVKSVFENFDKDKSGSLDTDEIEAVMTSLGITPFKAQIAAAIEVVDEDETGTIDFKEFVHLLTVYRKTEGFSDIQVLRLYRVFKKFANEPDASGIREVPPDNLREALIFMFGPQAMSLAAKLANVAMQKMADRKEEKAALRRQATRGIQEDDDADKGMKFREFLVWARRLREAEIDEYRMVFKKADPDCSGTLDADELKAVLRTLGYTPLTATVNDLMEQCDGEGGDGLIEFDEFVTMMEVFRRTDGFNRAEVAELKETFKAFDQEGSGEVGVLQVADIMRFMGFNIELEQAEGFVQAVDFNGSDSLDFQEFLRLMRLHREEQLVFIRNDFDKHCKTDGKLRVEHVKKALGEVGKPVGDAMLTSFLNAEGGEGCTHIDFDTFVAVVDRCRIVMNKHMQKQAGFSDEEVDAIRQAFDRYDTDGSGDISRKEMAPLLRDLGCPMLTSEDQTNWKSLVVNARRAAIKGGVPEDEVGDAKNHDIPFWTFIHLMRLYQTQQDMKTIRSFNGEAGHAFSKEELQELEGIYTSWVNRARKEYGSKNNDDDDRDSDASIIEEVFVDQKADVLPLKPLWSLLSALGINLTPTHIQQLKGKTALDPENTLPTAQRTYFVNFHGFIRLMSFMLDSNFANIRQKSDEIATSGHDGF
eukprot:TRINITY_DN319_c0_g1_i1.p1 TRINITY_DN319_c0_g1~~TRINITY_DN319_c0_g1_i1.p1  ORF type:complete len:1076 (+),score=224.38 TRINITY_DN319_c0_g1_i1:64-3291(+)